MNIDDAHNPPAPTVPHVGWQVGRNDKQVGHIFLDDVPRSRSVQKPPQPQEVR